MKHILIAIFIALMLLGSIKCWGENYNTLDVSTDQNGNIKILNNGKETTFPEGYGHYYIENDRVMMPLRGLVESLGGTVDYDNDTKEITIKKGGYTSLFTIGSKTYNVNGKSFEMDVFPVIKGERTYVPLRFVAESIGFTVTTSSIFTDDGNPNEENEQQNKNNNANDNSTKNEDKNDSQNENNHEDNKDKNTSNDDTQNNQDESQTENNNNNSNNEDKNNEENNSQEDKNSNTTDTTDNQNKDGDNSNDSNSSNNSVDDRDQSSDYGGMEKKNPLFLPTVGRNAYECAQNDFKKIKEFYGETESTELTENEKAVLMYNAFNKFATIFRYLFSFVMGFGALSSLLIFIVLMVKLSMPRNSINRSEIFQNIGVSALTTVIFGGITALLTVYFSIFSKWLDNFNRGWKEVLNPILQDYQHFIVGIAGLASLTMLLFVIINFVRLGAAASNSDNRREAINGIGLTGLGTVLLGSVAIITGLLWNIF